jgi:plastocyanin
MLARHLARLSLVCAAFLAGCSDSSSTKTPDVDSLPKPTFGSATLTGIVRFTGPRPEMRLLDNSQCHAGAKPVLDESRLVSDKGGLANVVVYLKDAPASNGSDQPQVVLDQVDCRYKPHVVAVQINQTLRITTNDAVPHNVHWNSSLNGDVNFLLPAAGDSRDVRFKQPEFLRLKCDMHPWMESWVAIVHNPFFATSDQDGRFLIPRLPSGTYTLVAWHEFYGTREQQITLTDSAPLDVTFEFGPRK